LTWRTIEVDAITADVLIIEVWSKTGPTLSSIGVASRVRLRTRRNIELGTEEFVKSLRFLDNPFTFEREQLALFLRTLADIASGDVDGGDSDEI
jgi:hypothetical protein